MEPFNGMYAMKSAIKSYQDVTHILYNFPLLQVQTTCSLPPVPFNQILINLLYIYVHCGRTQVFTYSVQLTSNDIDATSYYLTELIESIQESDHKTCIYSLKYVYEAVDKMANNKSTKTVKAYNLKRKTPEEILQERSKMIESNIQTMKKQNKYKH